MMTLHGIVLYTLESKKSFLLLSDLLFLPNIRQGNKLNRESSAV